MEELLNSPVGVFLVILFLIFWVVFLFVWTFLPFAIFGTKPILREILAALERIENAQRRTIRATSDNVLASGRVVPTR
jgi:hypothetical protein